MTENKSSDMSTPIILPHNLQRYREYLDNNWNTKVKNPSATTYTTEMLSGHVLRNMVSFADQELRDYDLWDMFKTVFEDWKLKDWKNLPAPVLKILRNFLFENGVYTKIDNGSIAVKLENLIALDDAPEFPPDEIQKWLSKGKNFNSFYHPTNINNYNPIATNSKSQLQNIPRKNSETRFETPDLANVPVYNEQSRSGLKMPGVSDKLVDDIPSREVTNLFKLYYDDNKKYGGELYDSLDTKLKIFQDCCTKVGIHETQYHHAFSTMLKGRAIDFYYETIALENFTFLQMVTLTKNHFETEAY
ncbi:hypothetical protein K3495_g15668, partial [Podosphaera aphanis]